MGLFQREAVKATEDIYGTTTVQILLMDVLEELENLGLSVMVANGERMIKKYATKASAILEAKWKVEGSDFTESISLLIDKDREVPWVEGESTFDESKIIHNKLRVIGRAFARLGYSVRTRQACLDYKEADPKLWQLQILFREDPETGIQAILSKDCN